MSKLELLELLKFLGLTLLSVYISFSIFITFLITTNKIILTWTDNKKHSKKEYLLTLLTIVLFWPFYLTKSEILKEDK